MSRIPLPIEPKLLPSELSVLCGDKPVGLPRIDRMQLGLYRTMCLTSARFDDLFGNARFDDEYEATHGSLSVGTLWDERDEWDPSVRFRVRVMYRRSVYRDWLILELRSSVTWPRETLEEDRETNLGAGVAIEMQFGDRTRR